MNELKMIKFLVCIEGIKSDILLPRRGLKWHDPSRFNSCNAYADGFRRNIQSGLPSACKVDQKNFIKNVA